MKTLLCVLAVWMAGAVAAEPVVRPASAPSDQVADLRRMIQGLQAQVATLKDENAKLRAELAKMKKQTPAPAAIAQNDIKIGMTMEDADAVCEKRKWDYTSSKTEEKNHTFDLWSFGLSTKDGSPIRIYFEDGKVAKIDRY
jgi:regulator of replication initiation timing